MLHRSKNVEFPMSSKPDTAPKKARAPRTAPPVVAGTTDVAAEMVTPATAAPAATKPANANRAAKTRKPVATMPAVTKPAVTKPAKTKPVVSKSIVSKPAAPVLRSVPVTETAPITGTDPARPRPVLKSVPTPLTPYFQESLMATAFETNPEKIAETLKASVAQLNTSAEAAMTSGKAAMEQITAKSKEAVESSMKSLDEMTDMARGNVEAMLASAKTVQSGIEAMVAHVSEVTKKSFEEASAIAKSMASAKTPNEMMQLQTDFAKAQYDSAVAEFSKMTEMMVKLSGEAMEPMQNRIALATDKMKTLFNK
jgi:phasin family protein